MSNGFGPVGDMSVKQDEGTYNFFVGEAWSSSDNWATLHIALNDGRLAAFDLDYDQARELAALLLRAADNADLAEAIPANMAKREAENIAREEALGKMCAAKTAAEKAFTEATAEQRAAFTAAVDEAERLYRDAACCGLSRSVYVSLEGSEMPF